MLLYFIRHGIAEDGNFRQPDSERKLTEEGKEKLREVGRRLYKLEILPEKIISSPYVRARQTAEILAAEIKFEKEIFFDPRIIPSSSFFGLKELLHENADAESIMLVGHNPSISEFISGICANGNLNFDMKRGAVCCIQVHSLRMMRGELIWCAPAKFLRSL